MRRSYEDHARIADLHEFRRGIKDRNEVLATEDKREDHQAFYDYAFQKAEF